MKWIKDLLADSKEFKNKFNRPLVTLSYAQSIDGSIAAKRGIPLNLSGPQSLELSHKLRAHHDAILVGVGTIISDDPKLNVRLVEGRSPQPIILDSNLRFPIDSNALDNEMLPWIFTTRNADEKRKKSLEKAGVRIICVKSDIDGYVDIQDMLKQLAKDGINSLMVEGGTSVITNMLRKEMIDLFVITIAPVIVGGLHVVEDLLLPKCFEEYDIQNLPKVNIIGFDRFGEDLIVWGSFIRKNIEKSINIINKEKISETRLYSVGLKKNFEAFHYLVGGDWGEENKPHIHRYQVEVIFEGENLDENGFLIDIVEIEEMLDKIIIKYRNKILNDLSEFKDLNPSIENFSRILCDDFCRNIKKDNLASITIKISENEIAYASYRKVL